MHRRTLLRRVGVAGGVAAAGGLAGCNALSCGPGETEIQAVVDNPSEYTAASLNVQNTESELEIEGTVSFPESTDRRPTLDDTTGTALIFGAEDFPGDIEDGDCIGLTGSAFMPSDESANGSGGETTESRDVDILFLTRKVSYEED